MSTTVALPILLLGLLTLLGTTVTLRAGLLTPRDSIPSCCRRRVDSFTARARLTVLAALAAAGVGAVLLVVGLFVR